MESFLGQIADFITTHRGWAGPVIGVLSFIEGLAIVGILIPVPPLMITVGGLIAAGVIDPAPVLAGAIVGASLGFAASYLLGRWLGPGVVHRWPLKHYRTAVARSRLVFRRYAMLAVFACRFFGPLRTTIPLIAGVTGMNQRRFHAVNVASAIIWAPAMMAPGWLAARGIAQLEDLGEARWLAVTAAGLLLAVLLVAVGFKLQRDRLIRLRRRQNRLIRRQNTASA